MADELPHILVVDDDTRLRELLRRYLMEQNFRVTTATDAAEARAKLASIAFDLLVLDIMMPGEDGLALTRSLRGESGVPILLLTAMSETEDRIEGLASGADDYLTKPFEPRELVLRVRSILRRAAPPAEAVIESLRFGEFCFDLARDELRRGDAFVRLTAVEASLLKALARKPGVAVSREDLVAASPIAGNVRTIDVQMARLRRKLEPDPKFPRYLKTVRGTGYILQPD
ncbi:MAG: response regulator [Kiloniellales bacterium]